MYCSEQELQDKTKWEAEAMKEHPEILEIIERIRPLNRYSILSTIYLLFNYWQMNRAASFGRLFAASKTPVGVGQDDILSRDILVQLILQHLHFQGLLVSRKLLEEESKVKCIPFYLPFFSFCITHILFYPHRCWLSIGWKQAGNVGITGSQRYWESVGPGCGWWAYWRDPENDWRVHDRHGSFPWEWRRWCKCIFYLLISLAFVACKFLFDVMKIWDDEPFSNVVYVDEKDNIEGLMLMSTPGTYIILL